jgi:hypothetical protein
MTTIAIGTGTVIETVIETAIETVIETATETVIETATAIETTGTAPASGRSWSATDDAFAPAERWLVVF